MLPVGCDTFSAAIWSLEAAKRARDRHSVPVLVLPPIPYGIAPHHRDFAGTVSLDLDIYLHLIQNIVREVIRPGFKRIACASGHGGNMAPAKVALQEVAAQLRAEGVRDVRLYLADDQNCFTEASRLYERMDQGQFTFHASAEETSSYMHLRPDLLRTEGVVKPKVKVDSMPLHASWYTKEVTDSGASGDPTMASAEHGREILQYWPDALADFLKRVAED